MMGQRQQGQLIAECMERNKLHKKYEKMYTFFVKAGVSELNLVVKIDEGF
jgi:hypothetical protein